jgi:hypothetical protein
MVNVSLHAVRGDLAIVKNVATDDIAGYRAATRSIATNCRNSRLGLAKYCREGLVETLADAVARVPAQPNLINWAMDITLFVAKLVMEGTAAPAGPSASPSPPPAAAALQFAVGDAVLARRHDGELCEGTVAQRLADAGYLVMWSDSHETSAQLDASDIMPLASGMSLGDGRRRQRVAPAFILNSFLLKTAIPSADLSRVQMVVRDGADVNCTDAEGNSPLSVAIAHDAPVRLVSFLLSRGAAVEARAADGTPLQLAAAHGNGEIVACLLQHGADASVVDLDACPTPIAEQLAAHLAKHAGANAAIGGARARAAADARAPPTRGGRGQGPGPPRREARATCARVTHVRALSRWRRARALCALVLTSLAPCPLPPLPRRRAATRAQPTPRHRPS